MYIPRFYQNLEESLESNKVLVVFGPRRVGKTTLLRAMLARLEAEGLSVKADSGDNTAIHDELSSQDFDRIAEYISDYECIALDDAQLIPNIGMALKIIIDQWPDRKVVATGSSSFDLRRHLGEPLTGRKVTRTLYPVSQLELRNQLSPYELKRNLESYLVFGGYPEVLTSATRERKIEQLDELVGAYLFKDVLALEGYKGSGFVIDLTKLLAFQVGSEVSNHELAVTLGVSQKTVERYLDLLEQTFIICRVGGYSRNLRSEISHKQKYYFIDNGVRNAIIRQYNGLDSRNDIGALWENFIFTERLKKRTYQKIYANTYFWRTYAGQEVDMVEERDGKLFGVECKWNEKKEVRPPKDWLGTYPDAEFKVVTPTNYLSGLYRLARVG